MNSNIIEGYFMHHPYLVQQSDRIMPMAYLEAMAKVAIELLKPAHPNLVALVLGYPVHLGNQQAIVHWINAYMQEFPENTNFKRNIFPALQNALRNALHELNVSHSFQNIYVEE